MIIPTYRVNKTQSSKMFKPQKLDQAKTDFIFHSELAAMNDKIQPLFINNT